MAARARAAPGRFDRDVDDQVEQLAASGLATLSLSRAIGQVGAHHAAAAVAGPDPFAALCRRQAAAARGATRDGWTVLAACPADEVAARLGAAGIHVRRPRPPAVERGERLAPPARRAA